jgi:3-oxoacyl-[acyl-carrier-protein] synthase III
MPELVAPSSSEADTPVQATTIGAAVTGIGSAVPARVVSNAPIAARLGVAEDWIVARTGVRERRFAAPGDCVYEYAAQAGVEALAAAGLDAGELDLVLVATISHEQLTPSAAALVAAEIGADHAGAVDIGAACTGFVSALSLATAQIESGRARTALIVGADLLSPLTDRDDRSTAGLFGDGAGAAVLAAVEGHGRIGPVVLGADGSNAGLITARREQALIRMKGHDTFRHAVDRLSEATLQALAAAGQTIDEVELFVYHQANSRIISAVGERLGLSAERVIDCVPNYGNTSAASIPIALTEAERSGRLADGTTILLAAFGGGLTWGACTLQWGSNSGA